MYECSNGGTFILQHLEDAEAAWHDCLHPPPASEAAWPGQSLGMLFGSYRYSSRGGTLIEPHEDYSALVRDACEVSFSIAKGMRP